jgi:hypothetical protein
MKNLVLLAFLMLVATLWFLGNGCSKPVGPYPTPSSPPSPTPTATFFTPTITPTSTVDLSVPMGIYWSPASGMDGDATSVGVDLWMTVDQIAVTTAAVTLTTPQGDFEVPYKQTLGVCAVYHAKITQPYLNGQNYRLTSVTSAGTAYLDMTPPGGNLTLSPDGSTLSWSYEGNGDRLGISEQYASTYTFNSLTIGDISSPFAIPASAFPKPGAYSIYFSAVSYIDTVIGAAPGSGFIVGDNVPYFTFMKY